MSFFGIDKAALSGAALSFLLILSGCAGTERFGGSRQAVLNWAQARGFVAVADVAPQLPLFALLRGEGASTLRVYIEGDGAPWLSAYHPPADPTPDHPLALALAERDPAPAVAYLGRPCQYLDRDELAGCAPQYWIGHRFAPEVLAAYQAALDRLKRRAGAGRLELVGYSGGGVLATLLAGRRGDVGRLVTVAAPIDVAAWVRWHGVSPLDGSLDPGTMNLALPASRHFVGARDTVVPAAVVRPMVERIGGKLQLVPEFDHACCWSRDWAKLLEELP